MSSVSIPAVLIRRDTEPVTETLMKIGIAVACLVAALASSVAPAYAQTQPGDTSPMESALPTPTKTGHVTANGIDYYYAIYGKGEPLLLLHGGLGQIEMFGPNLGALAAEHQVIGVDLQGHGRTPLGNRPINLVDIGDDLAVILNALGYKQVDVMGYSFGGGAAFRLAIQHPSLVRRLVLVSTPFAQDGFYPEMLPQQAQVSAAMADMMKDTPLYTSYAAVAPDPNEFPRLLDAMGAFMRQPYDLTSDLTRLKMPVMLVYGDADMIQLEHIVKSYHLLGGAKQDAGWNREHISQNRLAILPNVTHYEMGVTPALVPTVLPFLE
jgi:pimeloyl-ACP methyl ester carboxylesterase